MKLLSQSDFAKQLHISRQAVSEAKKKGLLDIIKQGKREYINLEGYKTIQYMKNDNTQRRYIDRTIAYKEDKPPGKTPTKTEKVKTTAEMKTNELDIKDNDTVDQVYRRARAAAKLEEVTKKKLENAYKRGSLISREQVYNSIMFLLDRIFRSLELLASVYLSDVGDMIITAGKVTPEIRKKWIDEVLTQIDEAKKKTIKNIKSIEKEQAK